MNIYYIKKISKLYFEDDKHKLAIKVENLNGKFAILEDMFMRAEKKYNLNIIKSLDDIQTVKSIVCEKMNVRVSDIDKHGRKGYIPITRTIIAAYAYHFLRMSFMDMLDYFCISRSTLYVNCKRSLPAFMATKDFKVYNCVEYLAKRYNDLEFIERCSKGKFNFI